MRVTEFFEGQVPNSSQMHLAQIQRDKPLLALLGAASKWRSFREH